MAVSVLLLYLLILHFFIRFCVCLSGYNHTQIILFLQDFLFELAPVAGRGTIRQREIAVIAALLGFQNQTCNRSITIKVFGYPKSLGNHTKAKAILMIFVNNSCILAEERG